MSATASSTGDLPPIAADPQGKWLQLPLSFRQELGHVRALPDVELVRNTCLDSAGRRAMLLPRASDAAELTFLCEVFEELQLRVARKAVLAQKRRALLDPALQFLAAKRFRPVQLDPPVRSLDWLNQVSGAHQKA